jgi:hypothetical protein
MNLLEYASFVLNSIEEGWQVKNHKISLLSIYERLDQLRHLGFSAILDSCQKGFSTIILKSKSFRFFFSIFG